MLVVDKAKCNGDAICEMLCPVEAITMVDDKAVIDTEKCMECLACKTSCAEDAITES